MKEDRYRKTTGQAETRKLSLFERVIYGVMLLVTVLAMVSLMVTLITPHINPAYGSILPLFGPLAPAIYTVNVILALYWIIRWEWRIVISMVAVLMLGSGYLSLFIKLPFTKDYDTESYRGTTKVMTYNIRGFLDDNRDWNGDEVIQYIEDVAPDILCLQELSDYDLSLWQRRAPKMAKYNVARHADLIVMSRYPILGAGNVISPEEPNTLASSMWVDMVIGGDTIRVINNHLQSTAIKASDNEYLTSSKIVRDTSRNDRLIDIASRFRKNCIERATQAQLVAEHIEKSPYALIVCGDLNDTPTSYSYTKVSKGLTDSFRDRGRGYSYTYRGFFNSLRIDYILCSEDRITPRTYSVDETFTYSDHLPVVAHLRINTKH